MMTEAPERIWAWVDDMAGVVGSTAKPETPPNLPPGPNALTPCAEYLRAERDALREQLDAIEEDGTREHNAAVEMRSELATLRGENCLLKSRERKKAAKAVKDAEATRRLKSERDAYRATLMDIAAVRHPDAVRSPHQEMARECVQKWETGK